MMYIAIDGDDVGEGLEACLLCGDATTLRDFSKAIEADVHALSEVLAANQFELLMVGGDTVIARGAERELEWILSSLQPARMLISVGVGASLIEAFLALKYAKASGKNRIVQSVRTLELPEGVPLAFRTLLFERRPHR